MSEHKPYFDFLTNVQQDALTDRVRDMLAQAAKHDTKARELRCEAGKLIAELRSNQPANSAWYRLLGLDKASAERLIEIGCGASLQPTGHTPLKIYQP